MVEAFIATFLAFHGVLELECSLWIIDVGVMKSRLQVLECKNLKNHLPPT